MRPKIASFEAPASCCFVSAHHTCKKRAIRPRTLGTSTSVKKHCASGFHVSSIDHQYIFQRPQDMSLHIDATNLPLGPDATARLTGRTWRANVVAPFTSGICTAARFMSEICTATRLMNGFCAARLFSMPFIQQSRNVCGMLAWPRWWRWHQDMVGTSCCQMNSRIDISNTRFLAASTWFRSQNVVGCVHFLCTGMLMLIRGQHGALILCRKCRLRQQGW